MRCWMASLPSCGGSSANLPYGRTYGLRPDQCQSWNVRDLMRALGDRLDFAAAPGEQSKAVKPLRRDETGPKSRYKTTVMRLMCSHLCRDPLEL